MSKQARLQKAALAGFSALVILVLCILAVAGVENLPSLTRSARIYITAIGLFAFLARLVVPKGGMPVSLVFGALIGIVSYLIVLCYAISSV